MSDKDPTTRPRVPTPSNATREYWEQTKSETLVVTFCNECEEYFFYPRGRCPHCRSEDVEFREVSGRGTVVSYTTVYYPPTDRLRDQAPYVNALIDLEEGVRMMANLEVSDEDEITIGMDVEVTFVETEGEYYLPYFTPRS